MGRPFGAKMDGMSPIPDVLTDFEHRLTYATGEAQRAKLALRGSVRWFLQRQSNYQETFAGLALPELVEQAHVVVQLADVVPGSEALGKDGQEALEMAFDAAAAIAGDLEEVTEQRWARPEGTDTVSALWENLPELPPHDSRTWALEEISVVAARAIKVSAQLHGATFLYRPSEASSRSSGPAWPCSTGTAKTEHRRQPTASTSSTSRWKAERLGGRARPSAATARLHPLEDAAPDLSRGPETRMRPVPFPGGRNSCLAECYQETGHPADYWARVARSLARRLRRSATISSGFTIVPAK